ncbi:MAG: ligase-associated DNA damage response endonuclease PdeM [Cyclobacteriaceae bacterium]
MQIITFKFLQQNLSLHAFKAVYWHENRSLWIADMHLGKVEHFRKSGIAVPEDLHADDYYRLDALVELYKPNQILFLGDLFHSQINSAWEPFDRWVQQHQHIDCKLIIGNHDILESDYYKNLNLVKGNYICKPFVFSHKPLENQQHFNICGHIHPSVRIKLPAKQSYRLPCFYFGKSVGILPAFGIFTGSAEITYDIEDNVFIIADKQVVKWV